MSEQTSRSPWAVALVIAAITSPAIAKEKPDPLCAPLRAFVESVKPDDHRELAFHTIWGGDFKDVPATHKIYAKRCIHNGYEPASTVCAYLIEHGAAEFAGNNAERAISCLSPGTTFAPRFNLNTASVSFSYGTDDRGSQVTMDYKDDADIGGMVLRITADGY